MLVFSWPPIRSIWGLIFATSFIFLVGLVDDLKNIGAFPKLICQVLAGLIIVGFGIGINYITNPFGGFFFFDQIKIPVSISATIYHLVLPADLLTILWLLAVINTANFLDGLDGLASGVAAIVGITIFLLSLLPGVNQPISAQIAVILAGATLGFLIFNFSPAKIFMGDSGSMTLGLVIGVLAIIAGAKFATLLLVFALPIFDSFWVAASRIIAKKSPFMAGKDHLHHKLLSLGLSTRVIVLIFYLISAIFGGLSLISGSRPKFYAIVSLLILLIASMIFIDRAIARKKETIG